MLDISPNGCTLIAINEQGDAHMISLISQTVVHKYCFKRKVNAVKLVLTENILLSVKKIMAPGPFTGEYNALLWKVFHAVYDETTCVDWSSDSKVIAVGSKDMTVKLYPLDKNLQKIRDEDDIDVFKVPERTEEELASALKDVR
ncbi:wd40 repeat protein [Holotrichia oblita]|uniref:Wd40 repeat protein n=1 Tax=Holotrichia oblita TaxID=644536 RepID=A0ACB9SVI5_HOLOL|nr:wd40 repeat protein [Holotrichia oblita]